MNMDDGKISVHKIYTLNQPADTQDRLNQQVQTGGDTHVLTDIERRSVRILGVREPFRTNQMFQDLSNHGRDPNACRRRDMRMDQKMYRTPYLHMSIRLASITR
jgi:hypothetical protein